MQEIIHAFGIDWRLLVIQIFNFALLAGLLWYFLYRPVLNMLTARQEKIAQGVQDAEAAAVERASAGEEKNTIVSSAHAEAEAVMARSNERAAEKTAELLGEAQKERERVLADATARAAEISERSRKESEAEIAKAAILAAEKVLRTGNKSST